MSRWAESEWKNFYLLDQDIELIVPTANFADDFFAELLKGVSGASGLLFDFTKLLLRVLVDAGVHASAGSLLGLEAGDQLYDICEDLVIAGPFILFEIEIFFLNVFLLAHKSFHQVFEQYCGLLVGTIADQAIIVFFFVAAPPFRFHDFQLHYNIFNYRFLHKTEI